jgi:hypothetical protein
MERQNSKERPFLAAAMQKSVVLAPYSPVLAHFRFSAGRFSLKAQEVKFEQIWRSFLKSNLVLCPPIDLKRSLLVRERALSSKSTSEWP